LRSTDFISSQFATEGKNNHYISKSSVINQVVSFSCIAHPFRASFLRDSVRTSACTLGTCKPTKMESRFVVFVLLIFGSLVVMAKPTWEGKEDSGIPGN